MGRKRPCRMETILSAVPRFSAKSLRRPQGLFLLSENAEIRLSFVQCSSAWRAQFRHEFVQQIQGKSAEFRLQFVQPKGQFRLGLVQRKSAGNEALGENSVETGQDSREFFQKVLNLPEVLQGPETIRISENMINPRKITGKFADIPEKKISFQTKKKVR